MLCATTRSWVRATIALSPFLPRGGLALAPSASAFYDWAINNGYKKGLVLDKDIICLVKDIETMYYSPDTCQFVTPSVSALVSKGKSKQYSQNAKDFICKMKNQE